MTEENRKNEMHFIHGVVGKDLKGQDRKCQFSQRAFKKITSANLQGCTAKDTACRAPVLK